MDPIKRQVVEYNLSELQVWLDSKLRLRAGDDLPGRSPADLHDQHTTEEINLYDKRDESILPGETLER